MHTNIQGVLVGELRSVFCVQVCTLSTAFVQHEISIYTLTKLLRLYL